MAPLQNLCLPVPTRVGGVAVTRDELKRGDKVPPSTWHLDGVHIPATGTKARYRILYHPCISGTSHIPSAASESTPKAPFLILLSHTSHNFFHLERGLSIAKSIAGKKKKRQWPAIWQSAGKYPLWEPCGGRVQFSARMAQVPCLCLCLAHLINQSMDRDLIRTDQATNI